MKLTIYQGTNEVGGNCFELASGKDRVLFDCGLPLSSMDDKKTLDEYKLPIKGVYKGDEPNFKAIFISHAHPDHYGMLEIINPDIPVYMSKITKNIILKAAPLLGSFDASKLDIREIVDDETVQIGNFLIKAHFVDHSAAGSMAFEIFSIILWF